MRKNYVWKTIITAAIAGGMLAAPVSAEQFHFSVCMEGTTMEDYKDILTGMGISADLASDEEGQALLTAALEYNGERFLGADIYTDGTQILAALPELSETVYRADITSLAGQLEESAGSVTEEYAEDLFDEETQELITALGGIDWEGLAGRYMLHCSSEILQLQSSIEVTEPEDAVLAIGEEEVTCSGANVVIGKDAIVDLADATAEFVLQDEECGELLQMFSEETLSEEDKKEIQEGIHYMLSEYLNSISLTFYLTPEDELAFLDCSMMLGEDGSRVFFTLQKTGGQGVKDGMQISLESYNASEDTLSTISLERTLTAAEDGTDTDSYVFSIYQSEGESTAELMYASAEGSYNEETGDFGAQVTFTVSGENLFTAMTGGRSSVSEDSFDFTCNYLTVYAGGESVTLSGSVSGSDTGTEIAFDTENKEILDLFEASGEELEEEGEKLYENFSILITKTFLSLVY